VFLQICRPLKAGTEELEMVIVPQIGPDELTYGGFSRAWGPVKYHGKEPTAFDRSPDYPFLSSQVFLSDQVVEGAGPDPFT